MKKASLLTKLAVLCMCMTFALMLVGCGQEKDAEPTKAPTQDVVTPTSGIPDVVIQTPTPTEAPEHEHAFTAWEVNPISHWYVCECGEQAGLEEHDVDYYSCSVCGATPYVWEDGAGMVYMYNENDVPISITEYDENGTITNQIRYEREYDENGYLKTLMQYDNGTLTNKHIYALADYEGETREYKAESYVYNEDGTYDWYEWDKWGDQLKYMNYDENGNVTTSESYKYEYDEDGNNIRTTTYVDGVLYYELYFALDEDGFPYISKEVYFDENGEIEEEINYDSVGNVIE